MQITFFILLIFIFIFYINKINIVESVRDQIYLYVFNGLSVLFILIFLYYSVLFGLKRGLFSTFIIWCLFVAATPIPEAGLLVSVPLKNILKINLDTTQWVVSFIALAFLFYAYYNFRSRLAVTTHGQFLLRIINFGSFSIFVSSIISSVAMSYMINDWMDYIIDKKELNYPKNIVYFIFFIVPFIFYFYVLNRLPKL
jgi:hypothetical protein